LKECRGGAFSLDRVSEAAVPRGPEIPHDQQQSQIVLLPPVTSLGHQGWPRVFLEGPTFFKLCPIVFSYAQHNFPGGRNILQGVFALLAPPGYEPGSAGSGSDLPIGYRPIGLSLGPHDPR